MKWTFAVLLRFAPGTLAAATFFLGPIAPAFCAAAAPRPNILILYVDDMGWAQPGCYGGKLAPTPNIDALATSGVRFTDGYVSACVCAPSRVGLLTGRYQSRTGHDANTTNRPGSELVLSEKTIADRLKPLGYATGIVGKWHLGDGTDYLPTARGFDYAFGSVSNLGEGSGPAFYRGNQTVADPPEAPITTPVYVREATKFIDEHQQQPWFLHLAFNAVHGPHVASRQWLAKFDALPRRTQQYAAAIAELDDGIGKVMARLRELKLEENTLIFLISDNGGAAAEAEMGGLRGRKWLLWEGGIRVSWIASWKGRVPGGRVVAEPVIQLDVLPTALAAAGSQAPPEWQLDGTNLLPLLEGKADKLPPRELYFRFGVQHAVRSGDWKLVKAAAEMEPMLVNLAADRGEQNDLSQQHPEKKQELLRLFETWNAAMQPPRWDDGRWNGEEARKLQQEKKRTTKKGRKKKTE